MTAPASGRDDATLRGAVVLVVAIVIGLALLARSGGDGSADAADTTTASTTEFDGSQTTEGGPTDTLAPINDSSTLPAGPDDTRPPAEVTVVVLNGTTARVAGAAGDNDAQLASAGYVTLSPSNAAAPLTVTTIYSAPEFQADAEAIRGVLGIAGASIEVKPDEPLGEGADMADVVVVVGDDVASG